MSPPDKEAGIRAQNCHGAGRSAGRKMDQRYVAKPDPPEASHQVTALLHAWTAGEPEALNQLMPLVARELRRLARRQMAGERRHHTLQPTALINEAYVRLVDLREMRWQDRAHFFAMSARLMRRILVDYARA